MHNLKKLKSPKTIKEQNHGATVIFFSNKPCAAANLIHTKNKKVSRSLLPDETKVNRMYKKIMLGMTFWSVVEK